MTDEETITIPLSKYKRLTAAQDFLAALEEAGVDNWEGYSEAYRILDGEDD